MNIRPLLAPNPGAFTLTGTQTWLLGGTALIDPGPAIDSHIDAIRAEMPQLRTILITHRHGDHAPAAVPLKRLTGARIHAPRGVLDDALVDVRLIGGERFEIEGVGFEVLATPGHTDEHVCFLTAEGDLFTGDTVLGAGTTAIFPPDGRMADYLRSLRLLRSRNPRRILPAHGPVRDDAVALLDQYLAHRLDRERQILDAIAAGDRSLQEMRARIYPELDPQLHRAAEIQLTAHLVKLVEEGRADETWLQP
jgi:glyoxylase-like metal-dependent hydrolase (beta-lactamase superfamily II)